MDEVGAGNSGNGEAWPRQEAVPASNGFHEGVRQVKGRGLVAIDCIYAAVLYIPMYS